MHAGIHAELGRNKLWPARGQDCRINTHQMNISFQHTDAHAKSYSRTVYIIFKEIMLYFE